MLFRSEDPERAADGQTFLDHLNPNSLEVVTAVKAEPGLAASRPGDRFQFERLGYFCPDPDSRPGAPVFNRTLTLKDTWAKVAARG